MAITTRTREKVATVLQEHALGLGLTIPEVRERYPAKAVRRTAILEALDDLDAMGNVEWSDDRVRWVGPLELESVFGEETARILQDRTLSPSQRGSILDELSSSLVRRRET